MEIVENMGGEDKPLPRDAQGFVEAASKLTAAGSTPTELRVLAMLMRRGGKVSIAEQLEAAARAMEN